MVVIRKDVFFIHTKSDEKDRIVVDYVSDLLEKAGYEVWNYSDWEWEEEIIERKKPKIPWSNTDKIIYKQLYKKQYEKHYEEVDYDRLEEILNASKIIVFINPKTERLTLGMGLEINLCSNDLKYLHQINDVRYILVHWGKERVNRYLSDIQFSDSIAIAERTRNNDSQHLYFQHLNALALMISKQLFFQKITAYFNSSDIDKQDKFNLNSYLSDEREKARILISSVKKPGKFIENDYGLTFTDNYYLLQNLIRVKSHTLLYEDYFRESPKRREDDFLKDKFYMELDRTVIDFGEAFTENELNQMCNSLNELKATEKERIIAFFVSHLAEVASIIENERPLGLDIAKELVWILNNLTEFKAFLRNNEIRSSIRPMLVKIIKNVRLRYRDGNQP